MKKIIVVFTALSLACSMLISPVAYGMKHNNCAKNYTQNKKQDLKHNKIQDRFKQELRKNITQQELKNARKIGKELTGRKLERFFAKKLKKARSGRKFERSWANSFGGTQNNDITFAFPRIKNMRSFLLVFIYVFMVRLGACDATEVPPRDSSSSDNSGFSGPYTVNLMWVNQDYNGGQNYVYPGKEVKDVTENFLNPIFKWANVSRGGQASVNVWFDSAFITDKAVDNTAVLIKDFSGKYPEMAPIKLRDVREIPMVRAHPDVFSNETPVFFRVDLLHPITALHQFSTKETNVFVHSDLDVPPLSQKEIFDENSVALLHLYGVVMANIEGKTENGFHMMSNYNKNGIKAFETMIEVNIQRAYNALRGVFRFQTMGSCEPIKCLEQIVYYSYFPMIEHIRHLEGWTELLVCNNGPGGKHCDCGSKTAYDENDGLKPFGLECFDRDYTDNSRQLYYSSGELGLGAVVYDRMFQNPKKVINAPPSHFNGK